MQSSRGLDDYTLCCTSHTRHRSRKEDQDAWQWYFNDGEVYTRIVILVSLPTPEEDKVRPNEVGYRYCWCQDCMETTIGKAGEFCEDCIKSGCPDYQGVEGMSQECRRSDSYGQEKADVRD